MALEIKQRDGDDADYIDRVRELITGALKASRVEEVYVIRIDNWFDRKWLRFSGIRAVEYKGVLAETVIEECRQRQLTLPPFTPNRVEECVRYCWNGFSARFEWGHRTLVPHVWQPSTRNIQKPITDVGSSIGFVWITSNTQSNGRGSLMVYIAKDGETSAWYASLAREKQWTRPTVSGISLGDLDKFANLGRKLARDVRERIPAEEEALSLRLHAAINEGNLVAVSELLAGDIDIEGLDGSGLTPLLSALALEHWDCVNFLLAAGANPYQQTYAGWGSLHYCVHTRQEDPEGEQTLRAMLSRNVSVEARTTSGWTPLMVAARLEHRAAAQILLEASADTHAKDAKGMTALHHACLHGSTGVTRLLIENGARVGARTKVRSTALWFAASEGDTLAIELLHEAGASVHVQNKRHWTPLAIALRGGHDKAAALLKRLGARE